MENLSFDKGYKEYTLNGNENAVIRINTKDFGFVSRLEKMDKDARKLMADYMKKVEKISDKDVFTALEELDGEVRSLINKAFGYDVCTIAFEDANCLSFCGGKPMFINFLNAVVPHIVEDVVSERKASEMFVKEFSAKAKKFK